MKYAFFIGCQIPARMQQYEASARAVLARVGIEIVDVPKFNCCGYPMRNYDENSFILSSARNLAIAEKKNLPILTLCKCCFGSLKMADHLIKEDDGVKKRINDILNKERLAYRGTAVIQHILSVLFHTVGLDSLKEKVVLPYRNLKISAHYGCHVLRPSNVVQFDDPVDPTLFDQLVAITGAENVSWPGRLECCGAPLWGSNDELSFEIMKKKLTDSREHGVDYLCVACPWCHLQFDTVQNMMESRLNGIRVPSILYTQLLGLSMGIDSDTLRIGMNNLDSGGLKTYISAE